MEDPGKPVRFDADAILDDAVLVLALGVTHKNLAEARRAGRLKYARNGRRVLYRGAWVIDWLESSASATARREGPASA